MPENKKHQKHADLKRPYYGNFGRDELAIIGAPCQFIREFAERVGALLSDKKIAYTDQEHKAVTNGQKDFYQTYTDKLNYSEFNFTDKPGIFQQRFLFNGADLVLINGNHFTGKQQVVIIHPGKSLAEKVDKLTDVALILLTDKQQIPAYLEKFSEQIPVLKFDDDEAIAEFFRSYLKNKIPVLNGLVLAGGKSTRMHTDKGAIAYHGKSQRAHAFKLLSGICEEVFISGMDGEGYPLITDTFTGLGPYGGILSAMQKDPDAAWLTIACDLPYLTAETLKILVENRNPSKLATAFLDSEAKYPEPLITIWEPRAYPIMLQFLSQGYSCPRKVLINSDVELINAPDVSELRNVNYPAERDEALKFFGQ